MEATKEQLEKILPPRLEDAGLEDCALSPDSIKEAFFKAAAANSRASFIFSTTAKGADGDGEGDCVRDPWPLANDVTDTLVGVSPQPPADTTDLMVGVDKGDTLGPCVVEKGGGVVEEGRDTVVVVGSGDNVEERENGGDEEKEEDREDERPILVEGLV